MMIGIGGGSMDTLSHALIGLAVAGLSGHPISPHDPVYIATGLGAQAPDFDIIAQLRGNMSYLRQHRAFSHSFPGLAVWSTLIAAGLYFSMPKTNFLFLWVWAFFGGLSHIAIDYFNTHGAALFWPFCRRRMTCNILNVFDPVLLTIMLSVYANHLPVREISLCAFSAILLYIGLRLILRYRSTNWLKKHFTEQPLLRISVMPSLRRIFFWDFVIEADSYYLVGQIGALYPVLETYAKLPKHILSTAGMRAQQTTLGTFFDHFTPFTYFEEKQEQGVTQVKIYDLRYFFKDFIHSATITFDKDLLPCDSYMLSYGKKIKVPA